MSTENEGQRRRRHSGEAPPPDKSPEDEAAVDMGEAEAGVTEGVYFTKVPNKNLWHAFDEDDEPIGTVFQSMDPNDGKRWFARSGGVILPSNHGSATGARAFLAGFALGRKLSADLIRGAVANGERLAAMIRDGKRSELNPERKPDPEGDDA